MNIVKIKGLSYKYDKQLVLEDINLTVKKGDFLAIIGPNGGGKSTILKLIISLLEPTSGEVELREKSIGYVPQNTNININFPIKVKDVVSLGLKYEDKKIDEALKKVDMLELKEKRIGSLSGGQRQRVFIARALYNNPALLILDEPTASIDVKAQESIYKLLKELNSDKTIIVVSHDISVILKYATKVAYINKHIYLHDAPKLDAKNSSEHFCEVELMNMLEGCTCKSC